MPPSRKKKRARESGWLSLTESCTTGANTTIVSTEVAIPILQFSDTYNAIELYKVTLVETTGGVSSIGFIGSKSWAASAATSEDVATDRTTLQTLMTSTSSPVCTIDMTDDLGNGVIFPAERFVLSLRSLTAGVTVGCFTVRYRLKKVSDADLVTMLNQYLVN